MKQRLMFKPQCMNQWNQYMNGPVTLDHLYDINEMNQDIWTYAFANTKRPKSMA